MFQLTVSYVEGTIYLSTVYQDASKAPKVRKAKPGNTYAAILAWCAKNGTPVSHGDNCETWQFN